MMKSGRYNITSENRDTESTTGPPTQDETKPRMCRGSRCLVLLTVCLGIICVLLLVACSMAVVQYFIIKADRDLIKSYKNTVQEFNQTIIILQDNYTDLMIEKDQLQDIFNFVMQKKLELETRVDNLTTEKSHLQGSVDSLSQKKLELETRVKDLTAEKSQLQGNFDSLNQQKLELENTVTSLSNELNKKSSKRFFFSTSSESKSWSDSRQYCRDHGGDLAIIDTEEKQRHISSFITESVWIGLTDTENEGTWKWVDNSPLNRGFWYTGEPNSFHGTNEDCAILMPTRDNVNNWNDLSCTDTRKWVCET